MIYLVSKGATLFEVGLLEGIFHVTSFMMETPTGAVADIFGRKVSRLTGLIFSIIGSLLLIFSNGFIGFALSFVFAALSYNFESGAGEALIYDSLKLSNKEKLFMKITGKNEVIFNLTSIIALIAGGIIGSVDHVYVFVAGIGITCLTFVVGLLFVEPKTVQKKQDYNIWHAIKMQYKDSFDVIKGQKRLSYLIMFSALIGMFVTLSFFYLQVFWKENGFIEWQIGIVLAVAAVFGMAGSVLAEYIDKRFGESLILKSTPFIVGLLLIGFYYIPVSLGAFAFLSFFDSMLFVALRDYINKMIPSDKRATILSFESMVFSFFMIAFFPVFGFVSGVIGMQISFVILGGILLVFSGYNLKLLSSRD